MDFNLLNIEKFNQLIANSKFNASTNIKYVECAINGRIGNIILNIFSTYMFCIKYGIPFDRIVVNTHTKFIDYYTNEENVEYSYMENILPFFANIRHHLIDDDTNLQRTINLCKAKSQYIEISLDANHKFNSYLKYQNINFHDFEYIKINYFNVEFSDLSFYALDDNAKYLALFQNLFINNTMMNKIYNQNFLVDKKHKNIVGYSVRCCQDFKNAMPTTAFQTPDVILTDIKNIFVDDGSQILYVFSDDIEYCRQILNHKIKNIKFHENVNPYVDLYCLSLCDDVYGNKYSTFILCAKIMNHIIKINQLYHKK